MVLSHLDPRDLHAFYITETVWCIIQLLFVLSPLFAKKTNASFLFIWVWQLF